MGGAVLDALLAQAKAAITRGYLAAGLLPALVFVLGWLLYEARGVNRLREWIEPALKTKTASELSAATLLYALVVVAIGIAFYVARGLVLRTLRDLSGLVLRPLRRLLLRHQVNVWWCLRARNRHAEADLTTTTYLRQKQLAEQGPTGFCPPSAVRDAQTRAAAARRAFTKALDAPDRVGPRVVDEMLDGITAYYSIPLAARSGERQEWEKTFAHPSADELLARLYAEAWRRALSVLRDIHAQPLEEHWLAPTRLGNRVAALEDYATKRYKIATSTLFTRLWGTLGQAERTEIASAQLTLESFANIATALGVLTVVVVFTSLSRTIGLVRAGTIPDVDWWTVVFVGMSVAFCYGAYSASVFAFESVAENITRLIDLHRVRILTAFGFAPPQTFSEEQDIFKELNEFFSAGTDKALKKRRLDARTKPPAPADPKAP